MGKTGIGAQIGAKPPRFANQRLLPLFSDADAQLWRQLFRPSLSVDFSRLNVSPALLMSFKATLVWYAENKSSHHLKNMYERLAHFLRTICVDGRDIAEISADQLLNYRASLQSDQRWYVGNLSGFLQKWHSLNLPGGKDVKRVASPQLQLAFERIARLDAENRRLESENNQLLEQFARWAYNAHTRGLDHDFLNRALPSVRRPPGIE